MTLAHADACPINFRCPAISQALQEQQQLQHSARWASLLSPAAAFSLQDTSPARFCSFKRKKENLTENKTKFVFSCAFSAAMKEFTDLSWRLADPRIWGVGWLSASTENQRKSDSRLRRRKKYFYIKKYKSELRKMDTTPINSEKSHLIDEKSAKMYSLKLQRWDNNWISTE